MDRYIVYTCSRKAVREVGKYWKQPEAGGGQGMQMGATGVHVQRRQQAATSGVRGKTTRRATDWIEMRWRDMLGQRCRCVRNPGSRRSKACLEIVQACRGDGISIDAD